MDVFKYRNVGSENWEEPEGFASGDMNLGPHAGSNY